MPYTSISKTVLHVRTGDVLVLAADPGRVRMVRVKARQDAFLSRTPVRYIEGTDLDSGQYVRTVMTWGTVVKVAL